MRKYIGETEENLFRVIEPADDADSILFFDEADALFGRRTKLKDSHDRYANLDVDYLLDPLGLSDGVVVLPINRRHNLDPAFMRRLRFIVEFPVPDPAKRRRIWDDVFPSTVRRMLLALITGFALYLVIRWSRRCRRSDAAGSVQKDVGEAVEQKSSGSKAERTYLSGVATAKEMGVR